MEGSKASSSCKKHHQHPTVPRNVAIVKIHKLLMILFLVNISV